MKKPLVFWSLQEGEKKASGMKSLKRLITFHEVIQTRPQKNGLVQFVVDVIRSVVTPKGMLQARTKYLRKTLVFV